MFHVITFQFMFHVIRSTITSSCMHFVIF